MDKNDAKQFETDRAGNLRVMPVVSWTFAEVAAMGLLIKVDYYASAADLAAGSTRSVQLAWTPEQCRELARQLLQTADRLSQPPKNGVKH